MALLIAKKKTKRHFYCGVWLFISILLTPWTGMAQHQYRWKGYLSAGIAQQEQDRYRLDNNFPRYSVTGNLHSGFSLQGQLHRQVGKWISVGIGIGRPEFQSLTLPNRLFVEDVHLNLQSIGLEVQFYPLRSRGKINPYLQVGVKYQWFVKN